MRSSIRRKTGAGLFVVTMGVCLLLAGTAVTAQQVTEDVSVAPPSLVVGEPAGQPLTGAALEAETERIGSLVRCPVCQGLAVTDSPAPMAQKMKRQTRDLIAEGYTEEQILSYFERSYGEFVLLSPPMRGINWLVWLAPVILLAVGLLIVVWFFKRNGTKPEAGDDERPFDEPVDPYLLEVRRLAYGDEETKR